MKNIKKYIIIPIIFSFLFIFSGCQNQNETLAKNLDNTITNLVYSVSSLDWADSDSLNSFLNTSSTNQADLSNVNLTKTIDCENCNDKGYEGCQNTNCENCNKNNTYNTEENHENYSTQNNVNNPTYTSDLNTLYINNNQNDNIDYTSTNNQDLYSKYNDYSTRNNFSNQPYSSVNKLKNTRTTQTSYNSNTNSSTNIRFATQEVTDSTSKLQTIINSLITKRANILNYIDQLYGGKIHLSSESISAINAYMNIIKENTSYLNSNKGIVTNHLSQAKDIFTSSSSSPLINAYIIRTNEAISTRISKLESSLLAIDSICEILEQSSGTNLLSNNSSNISNQSQKNKNIESISNMNTNVKVNPRTKVKVEKNIDNNTLTIPNTNLNTNHIYNPQNSYNRYNERLNSQLDYNNIYYNPNPINTQILKDETNNNHQPYPYQNNLNNIDYNTQNYNNKTREIFSSNKPSNTNKEVIDVDEQINTKSKLSELNQDELLVPKQINKDDILKNNVNNKIRETKQELLNRDDSEQTQNQSYKEKTEIIKTTPKTMNFLEKKNNTDKHLKTNNQINFEQIKTNKERIKNMPYNFN